MYLSIGVFGVWEEDIGLFRVGFRDGFKMFNMGVENRDIFGFLLG